MMMRYLCKYCSPSASMGSRLLLSYVSTVGQDRQTDLKLKFDFCYYNKNIHSKSPPTLGAVPGGLICRIPDRAFQLTVTRRKSTPVISSFIPFAFVVCCLLDLVAELFCSWASENLGTCSADVEGVRVPDRVSRWRRGMRMDDHISDMNIPLQRSCVSLSSAAFLSCSISLCLFIFMPPSCWTSSSE